MKEEEKREFTNIEDRSIRIGRDAESNIIISGNGNICILSSSIAATQEPAPGSETFGPNPYQGLAAFYEEDAHCFLEGNPSSRSFTIGFSVFFSMTMKNLAAYFLSSVHRVQKNLLW